jgi:hypothetical protein
MPGLARAKADATISLLAIVDRSASPHAEVPVLRPARATEAGRSGASLCAWVASRIDESGRRDLSRQGYVSRNPPVDGVGPLGGSNAG